MYCMLVTMTLNKHAVPVLLIVKLFAQVLPTSRTWLALWLLC